jgi:hypothetical protein
MLPAREKHPSCPVVQREVADDGKAKIAELVRALEMIASGDGSLAGLVRVTANFNDGNIGVVVHRQGVHNGSSSWSFTRDDLAACGK